MAWALYATAIGYLGGATFRDSPAKALTAPLVIALLIVAGLEAWRRMQRRRGRDILGDPVDAGPSARPGRHAPR